MKIWDNIVRLIGLESDESKLNRFNDIKKSYDEVQLKLDSLSDDFMFEKSLYQKRIQDPDNQSIKLRIKEKWNEYLKAHRQEIQKAKKEYDSLKKEVEKFESTDLIKKNQENKSLQTIKKAYQNNIISLDDYNKVINKQTKREKTLYSDFILFNENYEVLLLKRSTWDTSNPGVWVLPGGHVDPGEDHLTAAKRELIEETGYSVYDEKINVENVGSYDDDKCHIEYFKATINQNDQTPNLQWEEVRDVKWVPVDELHEYDFIFNMKSNLLKILNIPKQEKTEIKKTYKSILGELGDEAISIISEALKNKKIEKSNKDYNKLLLELRERRGELKKEDLLSIWKKLMTSKNSEGIEEYSENQNRYRLKDITYWPQGLDLENCEVVYLSDEKVIVYAGGDWQKGKYVTIELDQNSGDGDGLRLEVTNISDECDIEQTKTERNKIRKEKELLKSELDDLYTEFSKEPLLNIRKRNFLIEKGFTEEANNINDLIEKAKKELMSIRNNSIEKAWVKKPIGTEVTRSDSKKYRKIAETGNQKADWIEVKDKLQQPKVNENKGDREGQKQDDNKSTHTKKELIEYAKTTSEDALNNAIKHSDDPKLRKIAHEELDRREKEEHIQEDKKQPLDEKSKKDSSSDKKEDVVSNEHVEKFRTLSDEQIKFYLDAPYPKVKEAAKMVADERGLSVVSKYEPLNFKDDKGFFSSSKANEYFSKYDENIKQLSKQEYNSLEHYRNYSYEDINSVLRKGEESDSNIDSMVEQLDSSFNKFELKDDLVVFRGISENDRTKEFFEKLSSGDIYSDTGFISTSLSDRAVEGFAKNIRGDGYKIKINMKKGQNAIPMQNIGSDETKEMYSNEFEFLLKRNSKFKVLNKKNKEITVELL